MRSANPALNAGTFAGVPHVVGEEAMTLNGAINCTALMLVLLMASAAYTWHQVMDGQFGYLSPFYFGGLFGGMLCVVVAGFKKEWSPVLAPLYAILEGFVLGGLSSFFELRYQGIVIQAVGLTFTTAFALLLAYRSGLIEVTQNFRLGVFAATGGIALFYMLTMVLGFFGIKMPLLNDFSLFGIILSGFVVIVAALNLVMDFDFIEHGVRQGVPKYMEWYAALGLMVTLVWLYIEFLRLLAKLRSRR